MFKNKKFNYMLFGLVVIYLVSHLFSLVELPVFADESIYIRWSQLIIDDWKRFLFFAMNDGKTPLFIWLLAPLQTIFKYSLFAARFLSVLVGLVQVFVNMKIIEKISQKKSTQYLVALFTMILPFWYFHHRMALMDGMLVLFASLSFLKLIDLSKGKSKVEAILSAGLFFGLAMFTKIPAVLFIPGFYLTIFFKEKLSLEQLFRSFIEISIAIFLGLLLFFSLKVNPSFGQLFSRGSDFLFPASEVLAGKWTETILSIPNYLSYFFVYLTPGIILLLIIGLFLKENKRAIHITFWSGVLFILPIAIMGRIVYPRYLFPATLFFTLSSVLSYESFLTQYFYNIKKTWKKILFGIIAALLISNIISSSFSYIILSITDSDRTPFVSSDITQYLSEWSSGHGISQTVELIIEEKDKNSLAVATEGYFGTLPDGLLMYLHNKNLDNLYLEGIGQPVSNIPESFAVRARDFDKQWLVVNSDRIFADLSGAKLVSEFCRPYDGPCLQVWDVTDIFEDLVK